MTDLRLIYNSMPKPLDTQNGMAHSPNDEDPLTEVELQLLANIKELMRFRRWKQADLAGALHRSQPWVSKRMSDRPSKDRNKWKVEDLEDLQRVFQLSAWELLRPGHGRLDRRKTHVRRSGLERRTVQTEEVALVVADASRLETAIAQTERVIATANLLYTLAENIRDISRSLLAGHTATIGDTPTDGALAGEEVGGTARGPNTKKAG